MRSLRAIRRPKTVVKIGGWHTGQKMPRTAFPLSKSPSYVLGSSYHWCVCEARGEDGEDYRILVGFDPAKEQYRAWLGLASGTDTALLARLEYHPSHNGWHCHCRRGNVSEVVKGVVKEPRHRDRARHCNASETFTVSELDALSIAFRVFNVEPPREPWGLF